MKLITISVSAGITGFESPAAEYKQTGCDLNELLIEHSSSTFLAKASGSSMVDVGIFDGDILIVDRHLNARNKDIVVANFNGELVVKVLDIKNRLLESANSSENIQAFRISDIDEFSVEGIVIRSIRCHRPSRLLGAV